MIRLSDNRTAIADLDGAKTIMQEIAKLTCELAHQEARVEKRIMAIKDDLAERTSIAREQLASLQESLGEFILANKDLFQKPRKVKSEFGEFGLQTVTELVVSDEDELLTFLMDRGYHDCMKVTRTIIKKQVAERMEVETFPGCALKTGDTAVCKVAKALVDEARGEDA